MQHLQPAEFVDALEDRLAAARQAHLDACAGCRARLAELRPLASDAHDATVPEPSPLFWDHFSRRVREAIDAEDRGSIFSWRRALALPTAAALIVTIVSVIAWRATTVPPSTRSGRAAVEAPANADAAEPTGEDWVLVLSIAQDIDWDTASEAGLGVRPGAAEHAVLLLSEDEQRELARLLREELKRPIS